MPQSLANILVHLIFSTKNRAAFIRPQIEAELFPYMATACHSCRCPAHKIGGTADHVHIVCSVARTVAVADLMEAVKADSSKWIKTRGAAYAGFAWQNGYGAFSIGQSQLVAVKRYIEGQKEHHRQHTFQDEYREFLRRYGVQYDERYVWD
jgi:REP element-mobilizing transposase RayT